MSVEFRERAALLDASDVAEILKVSVGWVYAHSRVDSDAPRPHIPCIRLGSSVRFRPEDLNRFIEENCQ